MKRIFFYIKIWWMMNIKYVLPVLAHNWTFVVFLIGKVIRFVFFGAFILFLLSGTKTLAGYSLNQTLFFYITFTFIDTLSQFLFREVYRFRPQIISGAFDLTLLKPMNPLFRVLMGGADIIDLLTIPPLIYLIFHYGSGLSPDFLSIVYYILLVINGIVLAAAFHISVLAMGIVTQEVDHTVMIFRDIESLGRFPVDIYREPLQSVVTYLIPIGLMVTFPAKALMGLVGGYGVLLAMILGVFALFLSLRFWNYALTKYTSASS